MLGAVSECHMHILILVYKHHRRCAALGPPTPAPHAHIHAREKLSKYEWICSGPLLPSLFLILRQSLVGVL